MTDTKIRACKNIHNEMTKPRHNEVNKQIPRLQFYIEDNIDKNLTLRALAV